MGSRAGALRGKGHKIIIIEAGIWMFGTGYKKYNVGMR